MRSKGLHTEFLSTTDLTVGYASGKAKKILFEKLNLGLCPGELVCFMGPNGVGKSTLLRTLAGLQKRISGEIIVLPNPSGIGPVEKKIAVVLTDRITSINMTARELITFGRYPYLDWNVKLGLADHEAIDQAIALTQVAHLTDTKLYELSDGQLQMVMLARALAQETPLLMLDEPTAHLDLDNRVEIMSLLRNIARKKGKAILVATHELDLALQTADRIWLAGNNKNIFTGIPEDLVLNGAFDEVFRFKGFDLKTGKVEHEAWRGVSIGLQGEGHEYLWTRNALERCGFQVTRENENQIVVHRSNNQLEWSFQNASYPTLHSLLEKITK
jgi:iron complex transport system ATP-binding protein